VSTICTRHCRIIVKDKLRCTPVRLHIVAGDSKIGRVVRRRSLRLVRKDERRDARVNLMRKVEFNARRSDILPRVIPRRLFENDSANILAMFKDTNGSPFSRRTRDIRSSKTSSAIYEPGLTATIYFANLSLFITRRHSRNPCARNAFPFVRQPFSYFRAAPFSESDIAGEISIILRKCRSHHAIGQNLKRHSHASSASTVQRILADLRGRKLKCKSAQQYYTLVSRY